jgi:MFS family permease
VHACVCRAHTTGSSFGGGLSTSAGKTVSLWDSKQKLLLLLLLCQVGVIFSVTPFAQFMVCPLASAMCKRVGREMVLCLGLIVLGLGAVTVAVGDDIPGFIIARILQGLGSGLMRVAGVALIIQESTNLKRSMSVQETVSSMGFLIGPLAGGFMYVHLGVMWLFTILAIPAPFLASVAYWGLDRTCLSPSERMRSVARDDSQEADASQDEAEEPQLTSAHFMDAIRLACLRRPALPFYWVVVVAIVGGSGFLDATLAEHLCLALGIDEAMAGLLFIIPPLVYAVTSLSAGLRASPCGSHWQLVVVGALVWASGMMIIGPSPPLDMDINSRRDVFRAVLLGLVMVGIGESSVVVPFVPISVSAPPIL